MLLRSKRLPPTKALQKTLAYGRFVSRAHVLARPFLLTWLPDGRFSSRFQLARWPCRCSLRCLPTTSGWCEGSLPSSTLGRQSTRSGGGFLSSKSTWGERDRWVAIYGKYHARKNDGKQAPETNRPARFRLVMAMLWCFSAIPVANIILYYIKQNTAYFLTSRWLLGHGLRHSSGQPWSPWWRADPRGPSKRRFDLIKRMQFITKSHCGLIRTNIIIQSSV